jgi:hypothetical protein
MASREAACGGFTAVLFVLRERVAGDEHLRNVAQLAHDAITFIAPRHWAYGRPPSVSSHTALPYRVKWRSLLSREIDAKTS